MAGRDRSALAPPLWILFVGAVAWVVVVSSFLGRGAEAAICFKCETHNQNCADPVVLGAPGVEVCVGDYCIKSTVNHEGIAAALRFCSSTAIIQSGCIDQVIAGMQARACVCREDFCNGSS